MIVAFGWPKNPFMLIVYHLASGDLNGCHMA